MGTFGGEADDSDDSTSVTVDVRRMAAVESSSACRCVPAMVRAGWCANDHRALSAGLFAGFDDEGTSPTVAARCSVGGKLTEADDGRSASGLIGSESAGRARELGRLLTLRGFWTSGGGLAWIEGRTHPR